MGYGILAYQSTQVISTWSVWIAGLLTAGLTFRVMKDFISAIMDDMTIAEAFKKTKKRFVAVVIGITVTALVAMFKKYYM